MVGTRDTKQEAAAGDHGDAQAGGRLLYDGTLEHYIMYWMFAHDFSNPQRHVSPRSPCLLPSHTFQLLASRCDTNAPRPPQLQFPKTLSPATPVTCKCTNPVRFTRLTWTQ